MAAATAQQRHTPVDVRAAFRRYVEGVAIVTTLDELGNQWGMTVTSLTSVSLDPPLLLVCIKRESGLLAALRGGGGFVVHLLAAEQAELARQFATPIEDKFLGARYEFAANGCARLAGVLASLECSMENSYVAGDHEIVVGRVREACVCDGEQAALAFLNGQLVPVNGMQLRGGTP